MVKENKQKGEKEGKMCDVPKVQLFDINQNYKIKIIISVSIQQCQSQFQENK